MSTYYESFGRSKDRDRDRDVQYSDDDDVHYKKTTVRRYKVDPERGQVERIERTERISDVDRREYVPDRPRSAFEVSETSRRSERERDYYGTGVGRVVYDDRGDTYTRLQRRGNDDIVVQSYTEDRRDDGHGGEVDRWHKETEYYEPATPPLQPIVIRNRLPDQNIFLQEAPAPQPVIVSQAQPGVIVIRENDHSRDRHHEKKDKERHEDSYYFERRERREIGPFRSDKREDEFSVERYERRDDHPPRHRHRHHHHRYASDGDYSGDDDYYVKKTTVIRHEESPSRHRKHLVEGALAGAGVGALVGSRRNGQSGELSENRGRKVIAGAALGALGTEVLRRAHSAYNEHIGGDLDEFDDRRRSRSRSRSAGRHSKLKTGLGIAAAALAVAGAAKYMQSGRVDREERDRGRSLHRYSSDEGSSRYHSASVSRSRSKRSRSRSVAKVAAGTAAVAGIVRRLRSKSRQRDGKERSHSRIRTGAEIAAAGLAGAAAKKMYDKHEDKKEAGHDRELNREFDSSDEDRYDRGRHSGRHSTHSLSRSRSRSRSAHPRSGSAHAPFPPSTTDADELGLVEYGSQPLYADHSRSTPAAYERRSYESAADAVDQEDRRRRRRRRKRSHHGVESDADTGEYADVEESEKSSKRTTSRSRLRNFAAGGAAAAAAAIGIKKYDEKKKRDDAKKQEDEKSNDDGSVYNDDFDRENHHSHDRHRRRDKHHRRDDDKPYDDGYHDYDENCPPSPPHASGGAYYPPAPPMDSTDGLMQHPNANISNYTSYNPLDHTGYPPPPPGPPPAHQGSAGDVLYAHPPPHAGPSASVIYPDAAVPLAPKADPTAYIVPPPVQPTSYPQPPVVQDPARSDTNRNPNIQTQPAPHDDDHVSAALSLTRTAAISATASLPLGSRLSKEYINAPSASDDINMSALKNVGFAPLSPQSSRTMLRHHVETGQAVPSISEKLTGKILMMPPTSTGPDRHGEQVESKALILPGQRRHSGRTDRDDQGSRDGDGDGDVEDIPDRFDSDGQPLYSDDARASRFRHGRNRSDYTIRRGDFEYNNPKREDGWHVRGQWGVAGTDGAGVERIANGVRGILDGFGSGSSRLPGIIGLVGGVLENLSTFNSSRQLEEGSYSDGKSGDRDGDRGRERQHHHASSDDDRKRKRRHTYDTARDDEGRSRRRDRRHRASSTGRFTDGYFFDHDGYDGQEGRKRRRSWAR